MVKKDLVAQHAEAADRAKTALPAQRKTQHDDGDLAEHRHLEKLVERAVEAKLHNYPLPGRRFSKRAFKLTRQAFKAAAWKTQDGLCPQLMLDGADLRRLAKHALGDVPEGTISSDITLINELADTEEGRTWFSSPLLNTTCGLRQVRLFLRSERTEHAFSFEVLDERDRVLVERITKEVRVGQTLEDMWLDQLNRNPRLKLRLLAMLKVVCVIGLLLLGFKVLPKEAQAAIEKFGREKIVEPLKRLFGAGNGAPVGSNVEVPALRDIPNARIIEERARLRLTPLMAWSMGSASTSGGFCRGNIAVNSVSLDTPPELEPPFVVVRNGVVIRDNVTVKKVEFDDRDISPGRSYTYAIGKRDPTSGEVMVGRMVGATAPLCPAPSPAANKPPALALTVDRATGPAPLRTTFKVSVFDDEKRVRPFVFDFGDGSYMVASKEPQVAHVYRYGGTFTAKVILSDRADHRGEALASITVDGPSAPPLRSGAQNPWEQWQGAYFAKASPVVGYVDEPFTIEMLPDFIIRNNPVPVAAYYWYFGDCLGTPKYPASIQSNKNCFVGPFKEPQVIRRFDKPGTYSVGVYIVYEDGGTANYSLGAVTAIPSDKWLATHQVDARTRDYYDQMVEAARYYPSKLPDIDK